MKAMLLKKFGTISQHSLECVEVPFPSLKEKEILVRIKACGVCRTDLHLVEGELRKSPLPIIPGHQIVGVVEKQGAQCARFQKGNRVGIAWLRHTCQACSFCTTGKENLCEKSQYTGYHEHGGYAEYAVVDENYAYPLPQILHDAEVAPLLCAGIIGYRAFKRSKLPKGGRLGIYGFGSSAHIIIQVALFQGSEVFVATRSEKHQALAKKMGASWVGAGNKPLPSQVDSAIIFAPAGNLVPLALESLKKGGTLALAGITMSAIPSLDYEKHLFHEKNLCSVEANTRDDGKELLELAHQIPLKPHIVIFPLEKANEALYQLKHDAFEGSAVLLI